MTIEEGSFTGGGGEWRRVETQHSVLFEQTDASSGEWLDLIDIPDDIETTEFRFVLKDASYEGGFRTSSPFAAEEHPSDVAQRLNVYSDVVRVIYGKSE